MAIYSTNSGAGTSDVNLTVAGIRSVIIAGVTVNDAVLEFKTGGAGGTIIATVNIPDTSAAPLVLDDVAYAAQADTLTVNRTTSTAVGTLIAWS